MGDFFKNNKFGLGIAALGALIGTALTGGFGLGAIAITVAGFLAASFLGDKKDGIVSQTLDKIAPKGDTPKKNSAPQAERETETTPPAMNSTPPAKELPTDAIRVLDEKGISLLPKTPDNSAFTIDAGQTGKPTHVVFGTISDDKKTFQVEAISSMTEQGLVNNAGSWAKQIPLAMPITDGVIDLGQPEFQEAVAFSQKRAEENPGMAPVALALASGKEPGEMHASLGSTEIDDKPYNVVMAGQQIGGVVLFNQFALQDDKGEMLRDNAGNVISAKFLESKEPVPVKNGHIVVSADTLETLRENASVAIGNINAKRQSDAAMQLVDSDGKPINAAADGSQVIVLETKGKNTGVMQSYLAQQMNNTDLPETLRKFDQNADLRLVRAAHGKIDPKTGNFVVDNVKVALFMPEDDLALHTNDEKTSYTVEETQKALRNAAYGEIIEGRESIRVSVRSDYPPAIIQAEARLNALLSKQAARDAVLAEAPEAGKDTPTPEDKNMVAALRQFQDKEVLQPKTSGDDAELEIPQTPKNPTPDIAQTTEQPAR